MANALSAAAKKEAEAVVSDESALLEDQSEKTDAPKPDKGPKKVRVYTAAAKAKRKVAQKTRRSRLRIAAAVIRDNGKAPSKGKPAQGNGKAPVKGKEPARPTTWKEKLPAKQRLGYGSKAGTGKEQEGSGKPDSSGPKPMPRYKGSSVTVARVSGDPMTEQDRHAVLTHIVRGLFNRPNSSREDNHVDLQGVMRQAGRVLINAPDPHQQTILQEILRTLGSEFVVSTASRRRRYVIGLPGYLMDAVMGMEGAVSILMSQNLSIPDGGITPINLFRGHGTNPRPILFVELTDEAIAQLSRMGWRLKTLTTDVVVRPANDDRQ
jgi:hypothetical protein